MPRPDLPAGQSSGRTCDRKIAGRLAPIFRRDRRRGERQAGRSGSVTGVAARGGGVAGEGDLERAQPVGTGGAGVEDLARAYGGRERLEHQLVDVVAERHQPQPTAEPAADQLHRLGQVGDVDRTRGADQPQEEVVVPRVARRHRPARVDARDEPAVEHQRHQREVVDPAVPQLRADLGRHPPDLLAGQVPQHVGEVHGVVHQGTASGLGGGGDPRGVVRRQRRASAVAGHRRR